MKNKKMLIKAISMIIIFAIFAAGSAIANDKTLMMATTTSTDNTGLLDYLAPHFTKSTGIELKWVAVGTGKALKLGQNCDVDVLLVHAPAAEKIYIANGYGINRKKIMFNDFVIIGPESDPAKIKGMTIEKALMTIRDKKNIFVSRGDNSGTNKKEIILWNTSNMPVPEKESWYVQTGQGMMATINIAAERNGYTMTDRGTYIKYEANMGSNLTQKILVEGDKILLNQYSVLEVNFKKCPKVKNNLAKMFSNWMASKNAQNLIKDFKLLGKQLFTPNAL